MEIVLRPEEAKDRRLVEELTREAFWNVYVPGCSEHLLVHRLRKADVFVKELDFVAMYDDTLAGNIVYALTRVTNNGTEHRVLTFGPVSVLPHYQNKGIGRALINHTIALAKAMGYRAVIIYGDPAYYNRFGFKQSKEYGITNRDGKYPAALLVLELYPNALAEVAGVFEEGAIYEIHEKELDEFEKGFDQKEKGFLQSQEQFVAIANRYL